MKCRMQTLSVSLVIFLIFAVFSANCEGYAWNCPNCGRIDNTGNYCGGCAHPAPWLEEVPVSEPARQSIKVGDYITFGHYPQTSEGNDNTSIEWLVLDVQEDKALLISRYGLDGQQYHDTYEDTTWEKCSLRAWLNGTFINRAFTAEEQKYIMATNVDNGKNQGDRCYPDTYGKGGNNTQDKIFLLSYMEAWTSYLKNDDARKCDSTDYTIKYIDASLPIGMWWLRSPGGQLTKASYISQEGYGGAGPVYDYLIIRPALWVDLNSGII